MPDVDIQYPEAARPNAGYWLRWKNIWPSRWKFLRWDNSTRWRYDFERANPPEQSRSLPFTDLLRAGGGAEFKFIVVGDTGEGDRSQYGTLPLIRALDPDFIIINGDVAYPAGRNEDYARGFFEPYRGLDIPIWATAGNHEYYSTNCGREFHEIFCTPKWEAEWSRVGLRFVPQPGMYWELKDPTGTVPLVVIGLDSGKKANLDGRGWRKQADAEQHYWLEYRLREAQRSGHSVLVLFHIPGLKKDKHDKGTHLTAVHALIARYSCVKLVICGHEHNFQQYGESVFSSYLTEQHGAAPGAGATPQLMVSGGGGAYLGHTDYKHGPFPGDRYPSPDQWTAYRKWGRAVVRKMGLDKSLVGRVAGWIEKATLSDADAAQYLNWVLVTVSPGECRATPVFLDDLKNLYDHLPPGSSVSVTDPNPPVNRVRVDDCLQQSRAVRIY